MAKQFITITENRMGNWHIWPGRKHVNTSNGFNHKVNGQESPVYIQREDNIQEFKKYLSKQQIRDLEGGWTVVTNKIPVEYFEHEFSHYNPNLEVKE